MGLLAEPLLSPLKYPRKAFLEGVGLGGVGVFPAKLSLEFKLTAEWELWDYTSRKGDVPSLSRLLGPSEGCREALLGCACTPSEELWLSHSRSESEGSRYLSLFLQG